MTTISVVGLGRVGCLLAACLASRGYRVIGAASNPGTVDAVNGGRAPVFEPGLAQLIESCQGRLLATWDTEAAVAESQVTFIAVPTPSTAEGDLSLKYVLEAAEAVGNALRRIRRDHLVVLSSTVSPGSTDGPVQATLEEASGRRCGTGFELCYSPEFIAPGSMIQDFLNPDLILIGESSPEAGVRLEAIYRRVCRGYPAVARMNFVNAELAKLAVNTFATARISYANMLARTCERLPGADVDVVSAAIGLDSRIGPKYLKGAIGYGGPCLPRDNRAFTALARSLDLPAHIAEASDHLNRCQTTLLARLVRRHLPPEGCAGVLGLSYKPGTDVVEESPAMHLVMELAASVARVIAHDPAAGASAARMLGGEGRIAGSAQACIDASDVVAVVTPWAEYVNLPSVVWARPGRPRVVVDCWRALPELEGVPGVLYVPLGRGLEPGASSVSLPSLQPIPGADRPNFWTRA